MTWATELARADGGRMRLKWHMLRYRPDDPVFGLDRLVAAGAAGATAEIDLQATADGDWICLHDDDLGRETTSSGRVARAPAEELRRLAYRDPDGRADRTIVFLEQVVETVRSSSRHPDFRLQIDLKARLDAMTPATVARFQGLVAPIASVSVLSATDWPPVVRLGAAVEGLTLGYDPLDLVGAEDVVDRASAAKAADAILGHASQARWLYLHHELVSAADRAGVDLLAQAADAGYAVDVWTLDPVDDAARATVAALLARGCPQITTNDAAGWATWREESAGPVSPPGSGLASAR